MARRIQILIGLFLALVVPILATLGIIPVREMLQVAGMPIGRELFFWGLAAIILLYVLAVERRPLGSVGFRALGWKTFVFGILAGILSTAGVVLIYRFGFSALGLHPNAAASAKLMAMPYWFRVLLVTRAAFVEELLFRGYGIERLAELTGSRALAAFITFAAFTYAHVGYWGWAQLLVAGFGGLVFTVLYLWRRDLPSNMVAHWVTDAAAFLTR